MLCARTPGCRAWDAALGRVSDLEKMRMQDALDMWNKVDMSKALMVGDTLQTDIVFGNRGMMHTLLVLSGVTTLEECEEALASDDTTRHAV